MISVFISNDENGNPSVCITIGQDNVFLTKEDEPTPGVALNAATAREIARRLLEGADQLDGKPGDIPTL